MTDLSHDYDPNYQGYRCTGCGSRHAGRIGATQCCNGDGAERMEGSR